MSHPRSARTPYVTAAILIAIVLAALTVRIYPVTKHPEPVRNGFGSFADSRAYHQIAYNLYKGHGFSGTFTNAAYGMPGTPENVKYEPAIYRPPAYPAFIFLVYKIFGSANDMDSVDTWRRNWDKVRIAQCVVDSAVCILVFLIVRLIYPANTLPALLAAFLYCFSFYNIFYTRALLSETLTTFFLTLTVYFAVLGSKYRKAHIWFASGIACGILILCRPEYLLLPLVLAVCILATDRSYMKAAVLKTALCILGVVIIVAPWSFRNWKVFKKPIIVSTGGLWWNLYCGTFQTNTNWKGWTALPDEAFSEGEDRAKVYNIMRELHAAQLDGTIEIEKNDNALMRMTLGRITKHPLRWIAVSASRLPRLWYQRYIKMYFSREASGWFFVFYFIFALAALLKSGQNEVILMLPIWLLFIYLNLIFLPQHIEPRYGVNAMPAIIALTGIGIWKVVSWRRFFKPDP